MKDKKIYFSILCLLIGITGIPQVIAYNASDYDIYITGNPDPEVNIDSRESAQNAANAQQLMGYNATPYTNANAQSAYNHLADDNIFSFVGHACAGGIKFKDENFIVANHPSDPRRLSSFNNGQLDDLLLAVYTGCLTGETNPILGNLLDESINRGVDTALGFSSLIYSPKSTTWSNKFWTDMKNGYIVSNAASDATNEVIFWDYWQDPDGLENWTIRGHSEVNISLQKSGIIEDSYDLLNRPQAMYTYIPDTTNGYYQFADASTNSPTSFYWYFADGGTSTERNPIHYFPDDGYYTIFHSATNNYGTGRITQFEQFYDLNKPPGNMYLPLMANFIPSATEGVPPLTVGFTDISISTGTGLMMDR